MLSIHAPPRSDHALCLRPMPRSCKLRLQPMLNVLTARPCFHALCLRSTPRSCKLRLFDSASLSMRRMMTVKSGERELRGINELQWIRGQVWANLWREDRIASIDPQTGNVLFFVDLGAILTPAERRVLGYEEVLNGIAYDATGDRIWVTGKCWPHLFQIAVDEAGVGLGSELP